MGMRQPLDVPLLRAGLLTSGAPWSGLDVFASLDSTNAEALRRPQPWRVVVADHQSAGRGRLARQWQAPPRAAIAVTCVLPIGAPGQDLGWLPLLAGLAMRAALTPAEEARRSRVRIALKWPNDVLAAPVATAPDLRKVCGILCQVVPAAARPTAGPARTRSAGGLGALVVVGAGVNIDQARDELPVDTATSLRLCGLADASREDVVTRYLDALLHLYAAWQDRGAALERARSAYRSVCVTIGQVVDVHRLGAEVVRGVANGVDGQGRLLVTGGSGVAAHAAGDVVHVRPADGH